MWVAAGQEGQFYWLAARLASAARLEFQQGTIDAEEGVRLGWLTLRAVFRTWSIFELEDLTQWLRRQGFVGTQPGNHISARAQEHILVKRAGATREWLCWRPVWSRSFCIQGGSCETLSAPPPDRAEGRGGVHWRVLGHCWTTWIVKICSFRFCIEREREAQVKYGWRRGGRVDGFFALIPTMLLYRTHGSGFVSRDELAHRVEDFNGGRWNVLTPGQAALCPCSKCAAQDS